MLGQAHMSAKDWFKATAYVFVAIAGLGLVAFILLALWGASMFSTLKLDDTDAVFRARQRAPAEVQLGELGRPRLDPHHSWSISNVVESSVSIPAGNESGSQSPDKPNEPQQVVAPYR